MTEGMVIQGQSAGSVNEYYISLALDRLKLEYSFQYPLDGGRAVRGGQVVDFLVWAPPRPIAIYVQGDYWHRRSNDLEASIKQSRAEARGYEVLEIWEHECETPEAALAIVKEKVL